MMNRKVTHTGTFAGVFAAGVAKAPNLREGVEGATAPLSSGASSKVPAVMLTPSARLSRVMVRLPSE